MAPTRRHDVATARPGRGGEKNTPTVDDRGGIRIRQVMAATGRADHRRSGRAAPEGHVPSKGAEATTALGSGLWL
jgi:hypothetical protein